MSSSSRALVVSGLVPKKKAPSIAETISKYSKPILKKIPSELQTPTVDAKPEEKKKAKQTFLAPKKEKPLKKETSKFWGRFDTQFDRDLDDGVHLHMGTTECCDTKEKAFEATFKAAGVCIAKKLPPDVRESKGVTVESLSKLTAIDFFYKMMELCNGTLYKSKYRALLTVLETTSDGKMIEHFPPPEQVRRTSNVVINLIFII